MTLDQPAIEIDQKQGDLDAANERADEMRLQLQALAARSFVSGGTAAMPLLVNFDNANQALVAEHFAARGGVVRLVDVEKRRVIDAQVQHWAARRGRAVNPCPQRVLNDDR